MTALIVSEDTTPASLPSLGDEFNSSVVNGLIGGRASCMSAMTALSSMRFDDSGDQGERDAAQAAWRARGDSEEVLHMLGRLAQSIPGVGQQLQNQEEEIEALRAELQVHVDRAVQAEDMKETLAGREAELLELRARVSRLEWANRELEKHNTNLVANGWVDHDSLPADLEEAATPPHQDEVARPEDCAGQHENLGYQQMAEYAYKAVRQQEEHISRLEQEWGVAVNVQCMPLVARPAVVTATTAAPVVQQQPVTSRAASPQPFCRVAWTPPVPSFLPPAAARSRSPGVPLSSQAFARCGSSTLGHGSGCLPVRPPPAMPEASGIAAAPRVASPLGSLRTTLPVQRTCVALLESATSVPARAAVVAATSCRSASPRGGGSRPSSMPRWGTCSVVQTAQGSLAAQAASPAAAQGVALSPCTPRVQVPGDSRVPAAPAGNPHAVPGALRFLDQAVGTSPCTPVNKVAGVPAGIAVLRSNIPPRHDSFQLGFVGSTSTGEQVGANALFTYSSIM